MGSSKVKGVWVRIIESDHRHDDITVNSRFIWIVWICSCNDRRLTYLLAQQSSYSYRWGPACSLHEDIPSATYKSDCSQVAESLNNHNMMHLSSLFIEAPLTAWKTSPASHASPISSSLYLSKTFLEARSSIEIVDMRIWNYLIKVFKSSKSLWLDYVDMYFALLRFIAVLIIMSSSGYRYPSIPYRILIFFPFFWWASCCISTSGNDYNTMASVIAIAGCPHSLCLLYHFFYIIKPIVFTHSPVWACSLLSLAHHTFLS